MNTHPTDAVNAGKEPADLTAPAADDRAHMMATNAYGPMVPQVTPSRVTYQVAAPSAPKPTKPKRKSVVKSPSKPAVRPPDELADRRRAKTISGRQLTRVLNERMEWMESTCYGVPRLLAGMLSDLRSASLLLQIQRASLAQDQLTGNPWLLNDREHWCSLSGIHTIDYQDVLQDLKIRGLVHERRRFDAQAGVIYTELRFDAVAYAEAVASLREDVRKWLRDGLIDD